MRVGEIMKPDDFNVFKKKLSLFCKVLEDGKVAQIFVEDKLSTTHIFKFELYWKLSDDDYAANERFLSIDHYIVGPSNSMIIVEEYDYDEGCGAVHRVYPRMSTFERYVHHMKSTAHRMMNDYGIFSKKCPLSAKIFLDKMNMIAVEHI